MKRSIDDESNVSDLSPVIVGKGACRVTPSAASRGRGSRDGVYLALLMVVSSVAWCFGVGKGVSARWDMPTTYADPLYADFLGNCAYQKTVGSGLALPYGWKKLPNLGAPDGAEWCRAPTPEEVVQVWFGLITRIFGLFAGFNVGVLLGHVAAATTFYLVVRRWLEATPAWSFVGAMAFGLAPYLFAESPHHINVQYAWHLPLFPIVWTWVATEPCLQWRSRRLWQSIAIGFVTGLLSPYFTFIFSQLTLLGGAVFAWQRRSWTALRPALIVVGAAASAFFLSELDTLTYRVTHPPSDSGPLVAQREYKWMDIYGFKVVDLFVPWVTHHSQAFAKFGAEHRQASVLNDEEGCAYLGLLGIGCFLFLVAVAVRALVEGRAKDVPPEAWWLLWIVLFFNTGGINSLIASFTGFTLFRTCIRYAVMILVIVLLYAVKRLSAWQRHASTVQSADLLRIGVPTVAIACSLLILWDQVPRGPTAEQTALIENLVESDRDFVSQMEASLPGKAMVFQLPVMDGRPLRGVSSSDHYRPYLYSHSLRWSHGALPGTKTLDWQQAVQRQLFQGANIHQDVEQVRFNMDNVRKAVDEMRGKGFAAIYVNRNGFPDRGQGLLDALAQLGYDKPPIVSAAGDLACVVLGAPPVPGL